MTNNDAGLGNVQLHLVDSVDKAQEFLTWASQIRPYDAISIDIETGEKANGVRADALSPWRGQIRLVQIGDGEQGWAIPWEEWKGLFYEFMSKYDGQIVCHNIAFEAKWFDIQSRWKMPWHKAHDTMIMAHLIDPLGSGALKSLTSRYIDAQAAGLQRLLDEGLVANGWTWGTVPVNYEPYWSYGALDTVLTMRLFDKFYQQCGVGKEYSIPYELEMATRKIATRIELNGSRIDLHYSQKKYKELVQYTEQVKDWCKTTYKGTSITSNIQLVRLFESLGADITETTPSGQKSMTKDQLKLLVRDGSPEIQNLAETVLKQRKADKLASSYFSNFVEKNVDGIVHPSIRTLGARTGRMSITDPALQTLPSGDATVRRAFIPKEEDWSIISSDLDQVEFRLTANMSEDAALINLFNRADIEGGDVFTEIMREVYQDNSLQKSDQRRKLIKGVVYGKLYGAGVATMALTAGVQEDQMKTVVDAFDRSYPGVKMLQKKIEDIGMRRLRSEGQGYVLTRTGRRLPCDDDRVYSLTNYLVQASAAEVFKMNLVKLDQADLTEYMVVPVHDEIVLNCPDEEVQEIMQTVKKCMTTTDGWEVPLTAGVDGPLKTWGEKYDA
jgi:DNA polymerase-1